MANEKELKELTQEELIEKCEKLQGKLKEAEQDRDLHKRMYDRLYTKVRTIQNIIEL
jgi:ribosomal protein L19E